MPHLQVNNNKDNSTTNNKINRIIIKGINKINNKIHQINHNLINSNRLSMFLKSLKAIKIISIIKTIIFLNNIIIKTITAHTAIKIIKEGQIAGILQIKRIIIIR